MTKHLHISADLSLPLDWITLATVVYGARGSGKTSLGAVMAEEATKAGQRFCAIDLKGDWYGLKSTTDGKGDGIPVVVFGGDHQDVPLEEGAGGFVGETVANLSQSCILDLEYFSKSKQVRFLGQFFEALYDRNREPLLLLLDESQRYAPQKPISPDANVCLGMIEDVVKLGRKHGIGPVLFTQRGSGLNKEVSELCDLMVAFRTPGPLDQDRIKDWLDANTTKAQRDQVMDQLAGLPTGTAVFASGHPDLKIFGAYAVRRRETFDSSATPKVGQRRLEPKKLASPDLDELRTRMSAAIERKKAEDPKELQKKVRELDAKVRAFSADLERERAKKPAPAKSVETIKTVEKPVIKDPQITRIEKLAGALGKRLDAVAGSVATMREFKLSLDGLIGDMRKVSTNGHKPDLEIFKPGFSAPRTVKVIDGLGMHALPARPREQPIIGDLKLNKKQQEILNALAWLESIGMSEPSTLQVGAIALIDSTGGYFSNTVGPLVTSGLVERGSGSMKLSASGRAVASMPEGIASLSDYHDMLRSRVRRVKTANGKTVEILNAVIACNGEGISTEDIGKECSIDHTGGYFSNSIGPLSTVGLIERRAGIVRPTAILFPPGLS